MTAFDNSIFGLWSGRSSTGSLGTSLPNRPQIPCFYHLLVFCVKSPLWKLISAWLLPSFVLMIEHEMLWNVAFVFSISSANIPIHPFFQRRIHMLHAWLHTKLLFCSESDNFVDRSFLNVWVSPFFRVCVCGKESRKDVVIESRSVGDYVLFVIPKKERTYRSFCLWSKKNLAMRWRMVSMQPTSACFTWLEKRSDFEVMKFLGRYMCCWWYYQEIESRWEQIVGQVRRYSVRMTLKYEKRRKQHKSSPDHPKRSRRRIMEHWYNWFLTLPERTFTYRKFDRNLNDKKK